MPIDDARKEYLKQYRKDNLKRVPLDLHMDLYKKVKIAADRNGMSVNGYIKKLLERETEGILINRAKEVKQQTVTKKVVQDQNGYHVVFAPGGGDSGETVSGQSEYYKNGIF